MLNSFPGFCVCVSGWGYVLFASNCYPTCLPHQTVCLISKLNSGELNQTYPNPPVNSQLLNIVALTATSPCTFTPPYCKLRNDSFFTLSSSQDYALSLSLSFSFSLSLFLSLFLSAPFWFNVSFHITTYRDVWGRTPSLRGSFLHPSSPVERHSSLQRSVVAHDGTLWGNRTRPGDCCAEPSHLLLMTPTTNRK